MIRALRLRGTLRAARGWLALARAALAVHDFAIARLAACQRRYRRWREELDR